MRPHLMVELRTYGELVENCLYVKKLILCVGYDMVMVQVDEI
jgi:hypothetical protein